MKHTMGKAELKSRFRCAATLRVTERFRFNFRYSINESRFRKRRVCPVALSQRHNEHHLEPTGHKRGRNPASQVLPSVRGCIRFWPPMLRRNVIGGQQAQRYDTYQVKCTPFWQVTASSIKGDRGL